MLRRLLLLICAAMLLVSSAAISEESVNLLKNPGFEELGAEGMPLDWTTEAYITRAGISNFAVSEEAHSGQYAVVVENYDMNDARFAQTVEVEPNTTYRLSGWILADDILDAGHAANLSIGGVYVFSESVYETNGEWRYVETYGRTDSDQKELTVFVRVGGYSGESQGRASFDDIALEKVTELQGDPVIDAWYTIKQAANPNVGAAATEQSVAAPFWPWLIVIGCAYSAVSLWLLRHMQLDRREEALRELAERKGHARGMPLFAVAGIVLAGLARIIVALNVDGYQVDVNCFTAWGNTMMNVGPAMFYQSNWCDYTPGYIYIMGANGLLARALGGVVSAAFVHKLIPMACDLIAAMLIYRLAVENESSRRQAGILAVIFAFNPATFLNSAAWCQIDSVLCMLLMLVAYFAMQRKWRLVLPLYVLAILVKPQALMLGFLGLAAIVMEIVQIAVPQDKKSSREGSEGHTGPAIVLNAVLKALRAVWVRRGSKVVKDLGIGLLLSVLVFLAVVLPFSPNQESPIWLIEQYIETLSSYNHATVNTANIYYLAGANWDGIENPASTGVVLFFLLFSLAWTAYLTYQQRGKVRAWFVEPALLLLYAVAYLTLAIIGCNWTLLGWFTMSMAFVIVLPMYIRSGKLQNLPLCGAVIFLLLYVFGIKMHERYLFPAIFLLGMAYAIRRDRRIFGLLIGASCVLFINEGIILDNSLRLGSAMGHLNPDNTTLAKILSVLNVTFTLVSVWLCHRVCVEDCPQKLAPTLGETVVPVQKYEKAPCSPLNYQGDAKLGLTRRDGLLMLIVTVIYAIVTLTTLGSTKAPQNPWKSSAYDEYVTIDLGQHYDDFSMLYFCQVSYSNFAVAVSDDVESEGWSQEYPAQMAEGQCFQWKYLNPSYTTNGKPTFVSASDFADVQKLSGRYVRIDPKQVGLIINEIIFKDAQGNVIPGVAVIGRINENAGSPYYTAPANLFDEQDTLEGEPGWWNSTYFDEIYHARTAYELLNDSTVYEWTHPPLGKIIMGWFVGLFGMTPFGWRFAGALCGILMLPAMYLLAKQLTKRTDMACIAMLLMSLDCMHFTQTRIATIDSYPVLFIMLSCFFMLRFMQRDIVLTDVRRILPDLALSGFFMGCGVASKWIGVYAGIGLAVMYFWTCLRHLRLGRMAAGMLTNSSPYTEEESSILQRRAQGSFKRVLVLCLWCLLFFIAIPVMIYLLSYVDRFADRTVNGILGFFKILVQETQSMLSYHGTPGLGMDHTFYSPWYEWPVMATPMYYASAAFKPEGMTYAIFCFGNPWVWCVGLVGIAYTLYRWAQGHRYAIAGQEGTMQLFRRDWDIAPAFILVGLLAQFLPWVLVPRGTYIYHYFASVPFLILGTTLLLHHVTQKWPSAGKMICVFYLWLCLIWFILLFPYASGVMTPNAWMDFVRDYPWLSKLDSYWNNDLLIKLNDFLELIPIFPNVYHH